MKINAIITIAHLPSGQAGKHRYLTSVEGSAKLRKEVLKMRRPAVLVDRDGTLASVDGPADRAGNDVWEDYNNRIRFDPLLPLIGEL